MPRPPSPFVVAGRMGNVLEANMAAAKLRGAGINALVEPTNAFAATGLAITLNNQGVGILVPQSQAEQAEAVLEEFRQESRGEVAAAGAADETGEEADEPAAPEDKGADQHLSWGCIFLILLAVVVVGVSLIFWRWH